MLVGIQYWTMSVVKGIHPTDDKSSGLSPRPFGNTQRGLTHTHTHLDTQRLSTAILGGVLSVLGANH